MSYYHLYTHRSHLGYFHDVNTILAPFEKAVDLCAWVRYEKYPSVESKIFPNYLFQHVGQYMIVRLCCDLGWAQVYVTIW